MIKFNKKQVDFLKKLGIEISSEKDLSDSKLVEIEDLVSEKLQKEGFNEKYKINDVGKECEAILDLL